MKINPQQNFRELEAIFNYSTIGIVLINANGEIINFNKQAELQFGYEKKEILGKTIEALIPHRFHSKHTAYRSNFLLSPQNRLMGSGRDLHAQKKDGTEFPVEISLSYYNSNGNMHVIAFIIDITLRKENECLINKQKAELEKINIQVKQLNIELEQKVEDRTKMFKEALAELKKSKTELSKALEKEKELSDLKSRFVTMASHEFRTPLSTILSSISLIGKYHDPIHTQKREKHIQRIKDAVTDMKSILEDFLSIGQLEEGTIHANIALVKAEECYAEFDNLIQDLQELARTGQTIEFTKSGTKTVLIDLTLLKYMVTNLVTNAIKFSPEHTTIKVTCTINDESLILSVKDEGIGISNKDQQHLFECFFRAKNANNIQGTGLGLHIVSKYLELMDGYIEIDSKLNEGSTFTVHIPQKNKKIIEHD
ncbi:PAS domain-containing sensor histidine kinase [Solitalea koreensis]|uniref:histidine kinase n=1 Tax=Solitalea koreensis TaxID=543615 RepID=A0A521D2W0_9SPHI|nr:PAS domain-containing sensor histidine kinase [Solitalea koreensis]SMO66014.1 PAS domain S-box-containing protein [Solitalea koreensis]